MIKWLPSGLGIDVEGNVFAPDGSQRTQYFDGTYLKVSYKKKFYKVHRMMAEAFLGNLHLTVNHKDGDRCNNHLNNLEMLSLLDNLEHAFANNLHCNPRRPIRAICAETGKSILFESVMEATRSIPKAHNGNIYRSLAEPHRTSGGYFWREVTNDAG